MKKHKLVPELLSDDRKLHALIDELITSEQTYWRFSRRICKLQLRHQSLCDEDAFVAMLDIEQVVNERSNWMLATVARWAFHEGRRTRRSS